MSFKKKDFIKRNIERAKNFSVRSSYCIYEQIRYQTTTLSADTKKPRWISRRGFFISENVAAGKYYLQRNYYFLEATVFQLAVPVVRFLLVLFQAKPTFLISRR